MVRYLVETIDGKLVSTEYSDYQEIHSKQALCTEMATAVLFIIAKKVDTISQLRRLDKLGYIHT